MPLLPEKVLARNVVDLRVYRDPGFTPLIIMIDPQPEYGTDDGVLGLSHGATAIDNCRALLAYARGQGFPIAFVRWQHKCPSLASSTQRGVWIDGLAPTGSDMVFERAQPSCYASADFADMMDRGGGANAVVAGFTGTIACLSTVVDAFHRSHSVTFVADASASHATESSSAESTHQFVSELIALYCPVAATGQWIAEQTNIRRPMNRSHQ